MSSLGSIPSQAERIRFLSPGLETPGGRGPPLAAWENTSGVSGTAAFQPQALQLWGVTDCLCEIMLLPSRFALFGGYHSRLQVLSLLFLISVFPVLFYSSVYFLQGTENGHLCGNSNNNQKIALLLILPLLLLFFS